MTLYSVAYRMTAFKPRSLSSSESVALVPVAGAPHSDDFKITTLPSLAGWKPYMGIPTGRNGRLDVLNRKLDQGQITVPVQDQRLTAGGSNLTRWLTAYFGSLSGTPQMLGIKVLVEESLDGGSTWANYFTGRISAFQFQGSRIICGIVIRDLSSELNTQVFVGRAAASLTYVIEPTILPLGLSGAYGPVPGVSSLHASFGTDGVFRTLTVTAADLGRTDNLVTAALLAGIRGNDIGLKRSVVPNLRVRFTTAGVTDKEAELVYVSSVAGRSLGQFNQSPLAISKLWLRPVESTSDPYYQDIATGVIANATACTFTVRQRQLDSGGSTGGSTAIILNDVHPVQLWSDLLDGLFCRLKPATGAVARTFPKNAAAFATLIADTSFPSARFVVTEPAKMQDWIEKNILRPFGLGCYMNESGEVVPVDLRPPQSSPTSTTITNADLDADSAPEWSIDREQAISVVQVRTYRDSPIDTKNIDSRGAIPTPLPGLIEAHSLDYVVPIFTDATLGVADFGERTQTVEVQGLRGFQDEKVGSSDREEWIRGRATEIAGFFRSFFGHGPQYLNLVTRRTSNTNGVQPGTYRLIDVDEVPGLSSYVRGENRVMICVENTPKGLKRYQRYLDLGPNTVASQPTVGTPAQEASNTQNGITVAVTLNAASEEAVLWINPTATSVDDRPADSDLGWRQVVPVGQSRPWLTASGTYTVRNLPSDKRIWVRVRTDPVLGKKLSSAWAYPAGTGYVATAAMTAPSALASSVVSTKAALLTWTVGEATKPLVIRRFGAASQVAADAGTPVDFITLPAGTTRVQMDGLDTGGPWWHFDVYHKDEFAGVSAVQNLAAFQATGTAPTAPTPGGLLVLGGLATNPTQPPIDGIRPIGRPGVRLGLVPNPAGIGLDIELYRAPDSGGSPGAYALLITIPGSLLGGSMYPYNDFLVQDGLTYWYKIRHVGNGVQAGSYTTDISAVPGWLNLEVFTVPGEPVLGQELPIHLGPHDFDPEDPTDTYFRAGGLLRTNAVSDNIAFNGKVPLPVGAIISRIEYRGWGDSGTGNSGIGSLRESDESNTETVLASVTLNTGAGTPTTGSATVAAGTRVLDLHRYYVRLQLISGASGNAALLRATVWYIPNAYQQVRGS